MARRTKKPVGDCRIPPAIPDTALPDLLFERDKNAEALVRHYVEREGRRGCWRPYPRSFRPYTNPSAWSFGP
jgi:hypothetical protein